MKRMDFGFAHSAQGMLKQSEKPAACGAGDRSAQGDACKGDYPAEKPRKQGRYNIIEK